MVYRKNLLIKQVNTMTTLDPKLYKPMLAATAAIEDLDKLAYPLLVSPKIDGIRCLMIGGAAYSRSLKLIRNKHVQKLAKELFQSGHNFLDGELTAGEGATTKFQDTASNIMSFDGDSSFIYNIFDIMGHSPFECRATRYNTDFGLAFAGTKVKAVEQEPAFSSTEVKHYLDYYLCKAYEGVMLRKLTSPYKHGRSTFKEAGLLKLKPFADAEATIVSFRSLLVNTNEAMVNELGHTHRSSSLAGLEPTEMLGALECITDEGVSFCIGTGFTDRQRYELWNKPNLLGARVHYKYQNYGIKDRPRCPVFLNLIEVKE
jgi:DNA ligase-1